MADGANFSRVVWNIHVDHTCSCGRSRGLTWAYVGVLSPPFHFFSLLCGFFFESKQILDKKLRLDCIWRTFNSPLVSLLGVRLVSQFLFIICWNQNKVFWHFSTSNLKFQFFYQVNLHTLHTNTLSKMKADMHNESSTSRLLRLTGNSAVCNGQHFWKNPWFSERKMVSCKGPT